MLYTILFATLIYVNNGQIPLPDCTMDSQCSYLDSDMTAQTLLSSMSISGESFVCSTRLGYCTLTCRNGGATCTTINNNQLISISGSQCLDEGDGVLKCTFPDKACTASDDCVSRFGSLLPRCDNPTGGTGTGTCSEQTSSPTQSPVTPQPTTSPVTKDPTTAQPTMAPVKTPNPTVSPVTSKPTTSPITSKPTGSPVTALEACLANCVGATLRPMRCEADVFGIVIPCEDVESECEAECKVDAGYEEQTAGLANKAQIDLFVAQTYNNDLVGAFCKDGSCSDTESPTTAIPTSDPTEPVTTGDETNPPVTTVPVTTGDDACINACLKEPIRRMFCEADETIDNPVGDDPPTFDITIECTDVRNECAAQCLIDAKQAELTANVPANYAPYIPGLILQLYPKGLLETFCFRGTCEDGPYPTTTEEVVPSTTVVVPTEPETTDPCADPDYDVLTCPDDPGTGCGVQLNVTLDFCVLNKKFKLRQVWRHIKRAYIYAFDAITSHIGYCGVDDLSVEYYRPGYKDDAARIRGQKRPIKKRDTECLDATDPDDNCCEDIDEICGTTRDNKQFSLDIHVGFYCGTTNTDEGCADLKELMYEVQEKLIAIDAEFILKCLGFSVEGDTVCDSGFGGVLMEVDSAVIAFKNQDGSISDVKDLKGEAMGIKYGLAVIVAFIMAAIY